MTSTSASHPAGTADPVDVPDPSARTCDVLVVGGGPAGLLLAILLQQRGVDAVVLEGRWQLSTHSRAIGLHPPALAALTAVGLDAAAIARCTDPSRSRPQQGPPPGVSELRAVLSGASLRARAAPERHRRDAHPAPDPVGSRGTSPRYRRRRDPGSRSGRPGDSPENPTGGRAGNGARRGRHPERVRPAPQRVRPAPTRDPRRGAPEWWWAPTGRAARCASSPGSARTCASTPTRTSWATSPTLTTPGAPRHRTPHGPRRSISTPAAWSSPSRCRAADAAGWHTPGPPRRRRTPTTSPPSSAAAPEPGSTRRPPR